MAGRRFRIRATSFSVCSGVMGAARQCQETCLSWEGRANVAYAQSYLAVQYLYNEYGAASVDAFLDAVAAGKSIDEAMMVAIGGAEAEFQAEFFESLHQQFNITSLFMDTMLFWLGLAVVVIVAFVMRYNKRRRLFKQWEEEEKYQSTDFDYGDPDRPEEPDDDEPWRS